MRDLARLEIILHTVKSVLFQRLRRAPVRRLIPSDMRDYPEGLLRTLSVFDLSILSFVPFDLLFFSPGLAALLFYTLLKVPGTT